MDKGDKCIIDYNSHKSKCIIKKLLIKIYRKTGIYSWLLLLNF